MERRDTHGICRKLLYDAYGEAIRKIPVDARKTFRAETRPLPNGKSSWFFYSVDPDMETPETKMFWNGRAHCAYHAKAEGIMAMLSAKGNDLAGCAEARRLFDATARFDENLVLMPGEEPPKPRRTRERALVIPAKNQIVRCQRCDESDQNLNRATSAGHSVLLCDDCFASATAEYVMRLSCEIRNDQAGWERWCGKCGTEVRIVPGDDDSAACGCGAIRLHVSEAGRGK